MFPYSVLPTACSRVMSFLSAYAIRLCGISDRLAPLLSGFNPDPVFGSWYLFGRSCFCSCVLAHIAVTFRVRYERPCTGPWCELKGAGGGIPIFTTAELRRSVIFIPKNKYSIPKQHKSHPDEHRLTKHYENARTLKHENGHSAVWLPSTYLVYNI